MESIHLKVKKLVELKKIKQKEFAELIGKTEQTIRNYFSGRTKIDIDAIQDIAKALNVPVSYFFEEKSGNLNQNILEKVNNSNVVQTNEGDINYKTKLNEKSNNLSDSKNLNAFYWELIQSLMDNMSELFVKLVEKYPELNIYLKDQKEVKRFSAQLKTMITMSGNNFLYNQEFWKYFTPPN